MAALLDGCGGTTNRSLAAVIAPAILVSNPTNAHPPWVARGESYRMPGSFKVTLTKATATQAEVRFR